MAREKIWRAMTYDDIRDFYIEDKQVCGYVRNPITDGEHVRGKCSLDYMNCLNGCPKEPCGRIDERFK